MKELFTNPAVIVVLIELVAVLVAKLNSSDVLADYIILFGQKLKSKK